MSSDDSSFRVIAETERLRKQLVGVVNALDEYVAELLAEVAAHRTSSTSTEDDPQ